jgi:hypothetical protein
MADDNNVNTISSSIIIGITCVLILTIASTIYLGGGIETNTANFIIILGFILVVIMIAIPFVQINVEINGAPDNREHVKNGVLTTIGYTTVLFIGVLIITLIILRKHPVLITTFTFVFTILSFLISLIVLTVYTLDITKMP